MPTNTIKTIDLPIDLSKIQLDALDGSLKLKKAVASLDWEKIKELSNSYLRTGNLSLRKLYQSCERLRQADRTIEKIKSGHRAQKAIKSNELLLTNAIAFRLQAEIELQKIAIKNTEVTKNSGEMVQIASAAMNKINSLLDEYQIQLYTLILQKKTQQEISQKCLEFSDFIESFVPELAQAQVKFVKVFEYFKAKGISGNLRKLGFVLTQINQLTRECLASYVASHMLMFQLVGVNLKKDASVFKKINFMPYDIDFPDGKNVSISQVEKMPEGKFVELQGVVEQVKMVDTEQGSYSQVIVKDLKDKNQVEVVMPFVNIQIYGLQKGCYCNLNGEVRHNSSFSKGKTVVHIDKLRLNTSLEKAWRVSFLNLAAPNYFCWPKNLNMAWSIAINQ
ncbi:hypothetical protein SAMN04488029_3524 [Reichenbachiella faecimaris]|uniref:Uncharacterized protein n=1 Tax=Reichenbachiella faecimaris TaxID=692418 RepID=A0A1W2GMI6_REIFA|nr:hypothetical protein [Reichenbachiella faecimaris]SMD37890.1 hypothetical protein SAMN04488029_3524 [Reichenbachiella faecimaris]